jgi:hypothetical protein
MGSGWVCIRIVCMAGFGYLINLQLILLGIKQVFKYVLVSVIHSMEQGKKEANNMLG